MPRAPRFARAVKHNSPSAGKKSVKGNNRFGSRGCMKCDECRRRKTRCEFDEGKPHEPCRDCKRRGTECGKTLPAQTNGRVHSYQSSLSPSPSDRSSTTFGSPVADIHQEVKVESSLDNAPVALLFENAKEYASDLQRRNPDWSNNRILASMRHSIEEGAFGDLRILLQSPQPSGRSTVGPPIVVQSRPPPSSTPNYPVRYMPAHYPGPEMPHVQTFAGTVNPATLTVDHIMPYSFTEALNEEESGLVNQDGFNTMRDAEFEESPASYYVPPQTISRLTQKEMQPHFAYQATFGYEGWRGAPSM